MRTFVISLERSSLRRAFMSQQCEELGLHYEFVQAVDGYALQSFELPQLVCEASRLAMPRYLNMGAIGCALSHIKCYEKIIEEGLDEALILEDDMVLARDFGCCLDQLSSFLVGKSVLLLYYRSGPNGAGCHFDPVSSFGVTGSALKVFRPKTNSDVPLCTGAYIISKDACISLASALKPIAYAADQWNVFLEKGWLEALYVSFPRLATGSRFESKILYSSAYDIGVKRRLVAALKNFPVFNMLRRLRRSAIERKMSRFTYHV